MRCDVIINVMIIERKFCASCQFYEAEIADKTQVNSGSDRGVIASLCSCSSRAVGRVRWDGRVVGVEGGRGCIHDCNLHNGGRYRCPPSRGQASRTAQERNRAPAQEDNKAVCSPVWMRTQTPTSP